MRGPSGLPKQYLIQTSGDIVMIFIAVEYVPLNKDVFNIDWRVTMHTLFQEGAVIFVRKIVLLTVYFKVVFMVLTNFCSIYLFMCSANNNDLSYTI